MMTTTCSGAAYILVLGLVCHAPACHAGERACSPAPGTICTIVGSGIAGLSRDGLDPLSTDLYLPLDMTQGPDGRLYFLDWNNHLIRVLTHEGTVETVAGNGLVGDGPEGPALAAAFTHPSNMIFDAQGRMLIAAWHNSRVKRLDLSTGLVEDIGGTGLRAYSGDGGRAEDASMDLPASLVLDGQGNLFVMDQMNQVIRRIDTNGIIETVFGRCIVGECAPGEEPAACPDSNKTACGLDADPDACFAPCMPGFAGDGGPASAMRMSQPYGAAAMPAGRMTMDAQGNIYFADTNNHRVRRIDTSGIITTVAGNGASGFSGDGGLAVHAQFDSPADVAIAGDGTLYIADYRSSCVRAVSQDGVITTVAGICGLKGFEGDGGDAASALLDRPLGIELDDEDNLYVADTHNHRIRVIVR